jgi:arylsulfatase A-like enzyme
MFVLRLLALALALNCLPFRALAAETSCDVVIYGGTSAAITAAVQVKKMGKSVVIVSPDRHLGGLTSGGLGFTDCGNIRTIGGLTMQFHQRIYRHYQQPDAWRRQSMDSFKNVGQGTEAMHHDTQTMWSFEPHVAENTIESLIREHGIEVHRNEWLNRETGVQKQGQRIVSITTLSGNVYRGAMFLDTTYEGDLMAAAGVDYHVGREPNTAYNEEWNGSQIGELHHLHFFKDKVSPYRIARDPTGGLLPHVSSDRPGPRGIGDHRVQAYCYRVCMSNNPANQVPFPKPSRYDPAQYELLLRVLQSNPKTPIGKFDLIPNSKTDTNNRGPFSADFIGKNYDYPDASYEQRREIIEAHVDYQQGFYYFLANDPRVPESARKFIATWGLAKDEFADNQNWPHQLYVREARRMIGSYVMTENDLCKNRTTPDSIGMGSYGMDSHNVMRYVTDDGTVQNEGDVGVGTKGPYGIAYGSIVPKTGQAENLLVPVCASFSHIAYGSVRMEPVFMILGQSAATAAVLALESKCSVQALPYKKLRAQLIADGQILDHPAQVSKKLNVLFINVDDLRDYGGIFTRELVKTPNLDRLAARGMRFERSYVQCTVCNPSRSSYLTGLRCEQTGIVNNLTLLRERSPEVTTLPQLFKEAGWHSASYGKIFHLSGKRGSERLNQALDLPKSWHVADTFEPTALGTPMVDQRNMTDGKVDWCRWGMAEGGDEDQPDGQTAAAVMKTIREQCEKPWFIGCGFAKPHDPFVAPKKYFDLYPLETLPLWKDAADITPVGRSAGLGKHFAEFTDRERREFLRAYLAGTSFMDAQLGKVLDLLDDRDLWKNTIVVFLGDHGYHHGERGWWNKNTLFERTCHAPLLIAAPGMQGGQSTQSLVEFIDLLPTLADLCGIPVPKNLPGVSLRPVLQNPATKVKDAAFTLITRGNGTSEHGRRVRTEDWALTQWSDGATELYDQRTDPEEQHDVSSQNAEIVASHQRLLMSLPPIPEPTSPTRK